MRSRRTSIRALAVIVAAGALCFGVTALAEGPAPPSFAYLYGRVLVNGENVSPETQPIIALVNGRSCEGAPTQTFVATDGPEVPDEDVGRTVYVIDVLAEGQNVYEREGCGHPGDPILLYLPAIGRMSSVQPLFQAGPTRVDLDLDIYLPYRGVVPEVAADADTGE